MYKCNLFRNGVAQRDQSGNSKRPHSLGGCNNTETLKRQVSGDPKKKKKVINSLPSLSPVLLSDLSPLPSSLIAPAGSAGSGRVRRAWKELFEADLADESFQFCHSDLITISYYHSHENTNYKGRVNLIYANGNVNTRRLL